MHPFSKCLFERIVLYRNVTNEHFVFQNKDLTFDEMSNVVNTVIGGGVETVDIKCAKITVKLWAY